MGEYLRIGGQVVKIGALEDLSYLSRSELEGAYRRGLLQQVEGYCPPEMYLDPAGGWRYRFPFTDEQGPWDTLADRAARRSAERGLEIELEGLEEERLYLDLLQHQHVLAGTRGADGRGYTLLDLPCPLSREPGRPRLTCLDRGIRRAHTLLASGEKVMPDGTIQTLFRCPVCGKQFRLNATEAALVQNCVRLLLRREFGPGCQDPGTNPTWAFARYADLVYLEKHIRGAETAPQGAR